MEKKTILEGQNLSKVFKNGELSTPVIKNLDIKIFKNDFTTIMGESGSGKSTLIYLLSSLDKPTSGEVIFNNEKINFKKESKLYKLRKNKIGFIFQSPNLLENLTVLENVCIPGYGNKINRKQVNIYGESLLEQLNIIDQKNKYPSQLSGGQQQRVAITRSLINKPDIVFADEPTGALNSSQSESVISLLKKINSSGQTIVMVTHDIKTACNSSRIIYLDNGKTSGDLDLGTFNLTNQKDREKMVIDYITKRGW